jgi:hypothetical protein
MKSSMRGTYAGRYIDEPIIRLPPSSIRGSNVVERPTTMFPISTKVPQAPADERP